MKIEVSNGEILDKITILVIKSKKITDPTKLKNINNELDELKPFLDIVNYESNSMVNSLVKELELVNEKLWNVEDKLRDKERSKQFDDEFIKLARDVYFTNDERAKIKKNLNEVTNSKLVEEKSYQKYD
jgi:hypothetical protein